MAAKKSRTLDAVHILPNVIRRLLTIHDPDDLLPDVLALCRDFLSADEVSLLILSQDGKDLVEHVVSGAKLRPTRHRVRVGVEGVTGWVAAKRKPQIVADVRRDKRYVSADERRRSEAALPITSGDRLLGVLNFESNKVGFFRKTDLPLLEFLAAQIAIALRVAELHEREDSVRDRLAMLHHLARLSGGFLPPDQYLARAADVMRRTLGCYYVGIFQGDYERQELALRAHACVDPVEIKLGSSVKFGSGLIGKSFEIGEPINARDISKEPAYEPRIHTTRSEACVPIRVGDHCIGIIDVLSQRVDTFDTDDLMTLETIARFLVPVLHHPTKAPTA